MSNPPTYALVNTDDLQLIVNLVQLVGLPRKTVKAAVTRLAQAFDEPLVWEHVVDGTICVAGHRAGLRCAESGDLIRLRPSTVHLETVATNDKEIPR
ncbi:hypothetical protein [Streptosporangium canum]|uniref:hypothetical protein n=1 Tax=Streptosporangium canum TaxID=324952 RepID=UPI0037A1255C